MKSFKGAVVGDFQIPFHDESAVDVAAQIIRDAKVDVLFINGDFMDVANMSKFPSLRTPINKPRLMDFRSEIELSKSIYHQFVGECNPKQVKFNDGNHEYRTFRAFAQIPNHELKQIGEYLMSGETNPLSSKALLGFGNNVSFADYPHGQLLHPTLPLTENIWIEHGKTVQTKTGYTVSALQEKRQASVLINHVHRLSLGWKHVLGNRDFMMIENGHLSIFGVPQKGDGMYQGPHHTVADYQNSQQGFTMLTHVDGNWHPELIAIKDGKAVYHGKTYKSRIIAGRGQYALKG
jgi:predicted phosphodiesterase